MLINLYSFLQLFIFFFQLFIFLLINQYVIIIMVKLFIAILDLHFKVFLFMVVLIFQHVQLLLQLIYYFLVIFILTHQIFILFFQRFSFRWLCFQSLAKSDIFNHHQKILLKNPDIKTSTILVFECGTIFRLILFSSHNFFKLVDFIFFLVDDLYHPLLNNEIKNTI